MAVGRSAATIVGVRDPNRIKRYTLVPRSPAGSPPDGIRRLTLARIGSSPRSAPGADRLERMEQIAAAEREQHSRNGGDPAREPSRARLDDQAAE